MSKTFIHLISFYIVFSTVCFAQTVENNETNHDNLINISERINEINSLINETQASLKTSEGIGLKDELENEINDLYKKKEELEVNFDEILSGSDLISTGDGLSLENFSWDKELKELLSPIIQSLKDATSERRIISEIKSELESTNNKLQIAKNALQNIEKLNKEKNPQILTRYLSKSKQQWEDTKKGLETQKGILEQKLEKRLSNKKSLGESFKESFKLFFKSRGKNIIFSILAALGFFLLFRIIHNMADKVIAKKKSLKGLTGRVLSLSLKILTIIGSVTAFLVSLYLHEDWLLLVITLLVIIGIIFATKEAIPIFWHQTMLLLNMGPTREGEKVIINGVSFKVKNLNFYTKLENPKLDPDHILLPITDLLDTRSVPIGSKEPWFPSKVGDWVILSDGTHGKVISQNSDNVVLLKLGGSRTYYNTLDYISASPTSLSYGFRITTIFGLDYGLQENITEKIPELLKNELERTFSSSKYKEFKTNFLVDFAEAGASSLNIEINADFNGEAGQHYKRLKRIINRICVDASNKHGWTIPFDQLTLHVSKDSETKELIEE